MTEIIPTIEIKEDPTLKCNICEHSQDIYICRACKRYSPSNEINRFVDMWEDVNAFKIKKGKFFNIREIKDDRIDVLIRPDKNKDEVVKFSLAITESLILTRHLHSLLKKYKFKMQEE